MILCHQGSTYGPDPHLRPGDTITVDGKLWALIRRNGGFDGAAAVFRPHRADLPKQTRARRTAQLVDDLHRLDHALADFDLIADQVLALPPLEQMLDEEIDSARRDAETAVNTAKQLIGRLTRLKRQDSGYVAVLEEIEATHRDLSYQLKDLETYCSSPRHYWAKHLLTKPATIPAEPPAKQQPDAIYWGTYDPKYKPRDPVVAELYAIYCKRMGWPV